MLILSESTIKFRKSADYCRLLFLIHAITSVLLAQSSLPLFCKIILLVVLIFHLIRSIAEGMPCSLLESLTKKGIFWILEDKNGKKLKYEKFYIQFDGSFFLYCTLKGQGLTKNLIIFCDQLSVAQQRELRLSNTIQ